MKKRKLLLCIACLWFPFTAFALDPAPSVKIVPILKTSNSWNSQPILYPPGTAEVTGLMVELAPGAETGWHSHPVPSFGVVLEGILEVTLKDGQVRRIKAGEALAEVTDTLHNGRNAGSVPVKLVVFYAGSTDRPLTVKEAEFNAAAKP